MKLYVNGNLVTHPNRNDEPMEFDRGTAAELAALPRLGVRLNGRGQYLVNRAGVRMERRDGDLYAWRDEAPA